MYRAFLIGCIFGLLICLSAPIISTMNGGINPYYSSSDNQEVDSGVNYASENYTPISSSNYTPDISNDDYQSSDYSEFDPESEAWTDPSNEG
jgi:hypothetical protein